MPGNEDDVAANGQEERGDYLSADTDAAPPPLGVKLTVYRLLNITILLSIGITKGVLTYKGKSIAPTTLDWVGGALLAAVLYWIGLYEQRDAHKLKWLFQDDLAPAIGYCTKRFIGGVIWPLFAFDGIVFFFSLCYQLYMLALYLVGLYLSKYLLSLPWFWLVLVSSSLGFYCCALLVWYCLRLLTLRVRAGVWAWKYGMRFMDDYGPGASHANRYGWFGTTGKIAGIFCGIVLVGLPYTVLFVVIVD